MKEFTAENFSGYSLSFLICFAKVLKEPLVSVVMASNKLLYGFVLIIYQVYIKYIFSCLIMEGGDCGKRILSSLKRHLIEVIYSC